MQRVHRLGRGLLDGIGHRESCGHPAVDCRKDAFIGERRRHAAELLHVAPASDCHAVSGDPPLDALAGD